MHKFIVRNNNRFLPPHHTTLVKCRICQQPPFVEQPAYCGHCLIPVPPDPVEVKCIKCDHHIQNIGPNCPNCNAELIYYPPIALDPIQIPHHDPELVDQTIDDLGISHLSREDQAVALSSIAREKLHLMSGDYHTHHGLVLSQMAYHIAIGLKSTWAIEMTTIVLASAYLKIAEPLTALHLLNTHIPSNYQTQIQQLRALEHRTYQVLAYRMAGVHPIADYVLPIILDDIISLYHTMEPTILEYMDNDHQSEYLAMDRYDTKFPRLDYLVSILALLVEEAIIRGGKDQPLPNDLLDRFLELDNMIFQLGKMTPKDDAAFFAAQFREYIRLFNGIFWYGDVTIRNDAVKRQVSLEQAFDRVMQWAKIIPTHFFLILRPARTIEIFLRANSWSNKINPSKFMQILLDSASKIHQTKFLYIFAEAEANAQQFSEAINHIQKLLSESYSEYVNEDLQQMAQYMLQSIQLEQVGILLGVSRDLKLGEKITINLKENVIDFAVSPTLAILGLAIFGDILLNTQELTPAISKVNDWSFEDTFWTTPAVGAYSGPRMDIVVLTTKYGPKTLHMLFEGKPQQLNGDTILPSELLLLRSTSFEMEETELIQLMADILTGLQKAEIFGLQSKYT